MSRRYLKRAEHLAYEGDMHMNVTNDEADARATGELHWLRGVVEDARRTSVYPTLTQEVRTQENFHQLMIALLEEDPKRYLILVRLAPEFAANPDARRMMGACPISQADAANLVESLSAGRGAA